MEALEDLLAGDFRRQRTQGRIGDLVLGIEPGALGHEFAQLVAEGLDPMLAQRADHEGLVEAHLLVDGGGEFEELFLLHHVDLVDHEDLGFAHIRQLSEDALHLVIDPAPGVDQQRHRVRVPRPAPGGRDHGPVKPALGGEDAWRIHEDDLRVAIERDAAHQRAGGLHLARDDGDLGADQRVQQG